jgi:GNAT superfamily N-acetyltransferase
MHLRRLNPEEVELHRELRLRAFSEASEFLGAAFKDMAAKPHQYWQDLTLSVTKPQEQAMFLALEGAYALGSVYALLDLERRGIGRIVGMWVEPVWRRQGVGRALLQQVICWSRELGLICLELWVPAHSDVAIALYLQAGFRRSGHVVPLPMNPYQQMFEMEIHL